MPRESDVNKVSKSNHKYRSYAKMVSTAKHKNCTTKPLVINYPTAIDRITADADLSHISTLSPQIIFSSFIANQPNLLTSQTSQISSSAKQKNISSSNLQLSQSTTTKSNLPTSTKSASVKLVGLDKSESGKLTKASQNTTNSSSSSGHVVSARLIDMGKKLLEATREGQTEQVRQLVVDSGAPFTSDWMGTTALHLAAQHGHSEIADILLRGGVNRDARTKLERTALHIASQGGHLEVVNLLLIHGSDIDARDMLKMTPLHWAVERNHLRVAQRLLQAGADISAKSKFQLTPIDMAHNSEYYDMMDLFKNQLTKDDSQDAYNNLEPEHYSESYDMLVDYHLALDNNSMESGRTPIIDLAGPCIDLVELEWGSLKIDPDFFLSKNSEVQDEDCDEDFEQEEEESGEPKVKYLIKIVEELQKENKQLKQRVEQLSTTSQ